ncbi:MAG: hypothetical protein IIY55_03120 [Blautia sp.]|nr:hypothetical protein [Blautia sp.]
MSHRKKGKNLRKPLQRELEIYRENGISLFLDGVPSTPKSIARACAVAEDGVYMRDYTSDSRGRIARVDFDFIRERPEMRKNSPVKKP